MFRIAYRSDLNRCIGEAEVRLIAESSSMRNKQKGLSGAWLLSKHRILASIEGDPRLVRDITERVWDDHRHANFSLVDMRTTDMPLFSGWGFRLIRNHEAQTDLSLKSHTGLKWLCGFAGGIENFYSDSAPEYWAE